MRHYLLLLLALCLHIAARGQTGWKYEYWFDNDRTIVKLDSSATDIWHIDADVSGLSNSLHSFHIQVVGNDTLPSSPVTRYFYKMADPLEASVRYWFDNDLSTAQEGETVGDIVLLDVSQIADGFHIVHIQVDGGIDAVSSPITKGFIKIPQTIGVDDFTCRCFIDGQLFKQEKVPASGGVIGWDFDVSELSHGLHRILVQVVTPSGAASNTWQSFFLRETTHAEFADMKCLYAIDGAEFYTEAGTMSDGTYHFDLDVSALEDGLHRITYMLDNGNGVSTASQTQFFMKTPIGGYGITEYWYWLNEMDMQRANKISLSERQDPFSLISLLPVESQPIRSKQFEFRTEQDQPVLYAKNDIHIRFFEASGRFTDLTKQYVDESVRQEITDVELLEPGAYVTTNKPEENVIKWYSLSAKPGDSVQFKLDRAATIQLYAPSGEEVYCASGFDAVNCGGCHVFESGTYYLALHDVTATQGSTISLEYNHLDKYAVLRQDVDLVGNGGCSTITFEGNGFRDLYAVDLYNAQGDTIEHVYIGHESDATTSLVFDFSDAPLGQYNALFHFITEDKVFSNLITVEEARDIELTTIVSFPSDFPHGMSTTYTVKISNTGNMTAYSVPIYTWIMNKWNKDGIYHIEYDGLDLPGMFDGVDMDSISISERAELQALSEEMGDGHYFMLFRTVDEDSPNDSVWVRSNYFFTNIAPYETKTLRLTISANEGVWAYFTVPEDWSPVFYETLDAPQTVNARALKKRTPKYCCYRDKVECAFNLIADATTIINLIATLDVSCTAKTAAAIADCAAGIVKQAVRFAGESFCGNNSAQDNFYDKAKNMLNGISIGGTIASCASGFVPLGQLKTLVNGFGVATGGISFTQGLGIDGFECVKAFSSKVPGCPPLPPDGGGSDGGLSWDPNDIYGYRAKSGSKFMTDSVKTMNYTIEFENDPKFATASAYKVVVRDTLDSRYFDLASYAPTSVRIGNKHAFLDGSQNFVTTIDMRTEIGAIAQVEGNYDVNNGIMTWMFTSLDPMTMEPATDIMQGFLPVNYNGNGIGEVTYVVTKKAELTHGTQISNRASITFDVNESILTPTWTNVIDRIAPESRVTDVQMQNDSTVTVSIEATDELSGPWRYNVYVQYGSGAWFLGAENVPADTTASVKVYEGIDHGFYVVAIDSAGNFESKEPVREFSFEVFASQVDTDTKLQLAQGWNWISHNQQEALSAETLKPNARRIVSQTDELYKDDRIGWTGTLTELQPTELYKVEMTGTDEVQLGGRLFNATFRNVPLYAGWNWIGYPVANAMSPAQAFQKMDAEEGDFIVGQDGMTTFSNGQWTGTLTEMQPGQGYMYRSVSNKSLFLNATAQNRARRHEVAASASNDRAPIPEGWTVDKRKYPNVMGMVADLLIDEVRADASDWLLAAFSGSECRGLSQPVDGHLMMNVYGTGGETITFQALNYTSGEVVTVVESESFRSDILGTLQQPYELHNGMATGITELDEGNPSIDNATVIDLLGRPVNKTTMTGEGVYIVTDGEKKQKRVTTQSPKP